MPVPAFAEVVADESMVMPVMEALPRLAADEVFLRGESLGMTGVVDMKVIDAKGRGDRRSQFGGNWSEER